MLRTRSHLPTAIVVLLALAGCGGAPEESTTDTTAATAVIDESAPEHGTGDGHGAIEGAREVAEPQLHLVSIDADGAVGMVDLLDGTESELGSITPPSSVTSDGRYLFADTGGGVEIVDSGVWTWDHVDHFHYYRASPRLLGSVAGEGPATVATSDNATTGGTGLFFETSGEAVLLSNESLSTGGLDEVFRIGVEPHDGVVAPLSGGALITSPDGSGTAAEVRYHGDDGEPVEETTTPCPDARESITTRIGVVIGCADGAVLATVDGDQPTLEHIPYPEGDDAPAATDFRNRKGRPTVAALAGDTGFWLLDTRQRDWRFVPTGHPLVQVSAAGDDDEHVVALDRAGRVRVYDGGNGTEIAATEPLLDGMDPTGAVADPATLAGVDLTVDRERAYVNDPVAGQVHEIDYRGGARVARSLETPTAPDFYAETGR